MHAVESSFPAIAPALHAVASAIPWVPLDAENPPGKAFKPLRFLEDDRGFVELLRLQPGQAIPRHRHTGEVHAFNLAGWRELDDGRRVGPGDYVHEPAGNVDAWHVLGDAELVVLVVVMGAVEYLDADDRVTQRYTASRLASLYRDYCRDNGIAAIAIG
jgi:2,4'-dihydroxyacetophenone dioxygenase